ncbi:hypothetical protein O181_058216 [Austropuccinia psidii MF-1]|uniref:Uncharacterized protein n=1 Tax=Austropuccinia psidii MF-1 TaxID=1389203 RepID=A0A9Q3HUN1_9BASI|nr:hypothetical protein [Austropuccinia psidii MF-1]
MPLTPPSHWPLMILMLLQPPQDETSTPPPISALSSLPLPILTLPWRPQDMPPMPPSTSLTPNPLSAAYRPYAQVLDP